MEKEFTQLTLKECYDMSLRLGDKIENTWRQFYLVSLGVSAWSFSSATGISKSNIAILLFITFVFMAHSCNSLMKMYPLLDVLLKETYIRAHEKFFINESNKLKFKKISGEINYENSKWVTLFIHVMCYLVIVFIYLSR